MKNKKRLLHIIGNFIIACICMIPAGFLAERQNDSYEYYYNLYLSESDPQLLTMARLHTSRCWMIVGLAVSLTILLMSVYSLILKANSRRYTFIFVVITVFFAGTFLGINILLSKNEFAHFLFIINRVLIYSYILLYGFTARFDSRKQINN